jgi:hypothetical protein
VWWGLKGNDGVDEVDVISRCVDVLEAVLPCL